MKKWVNMQKIERIFKFSPKQNGRSFYGTVLLSFMLVSIVTALFQGGFLMVNYLNSFLDSAKNYNQQLQTQTNYAINRLDEAVDNLSTALLSNNKIQSYFSLQDIENITPTVAGQEVRNLIRFLSYYVDCVYLYNSNLDILYSTKGGYQRVPEFYGDPEFAAQLRDKDFLSSHFKKPVAADRDGDNGSAGIIRYFFPKKNADKDSFHVIVIDIHASALTDSIRSIKAFSEDADFGFILMDEDDQYLTSVLNSKSASDSRWLQEALAPEISGQESGSPYVKIDGARYYRLQTDANSYGWRLLTFVPLQVVFGDILYTNLISLLIVFVVLALSFLFFRRIARKLNTPIESLMYAVKNKPIQHPNHMATVPREIQMILSAVSSMQENNREMALMQRKTQYSLTQSYVRSLIIDLNQDPPKTRLSRLSDLKLDYLARERLCMVLLKIDDYHSVSQSYDPNDLWGIRFAVVNITEELARTHFTCNAFSMDNDKFVLLIERQSANPSVSFEESLLSTFHSIQENIENYMPFTISITYSTIFSGLKQFPLVYRNLENAMLKKMCYGHNCIIDPYQLEDVSDEPFQFSYRIISQMVDELSAGRFDDVWLIYCQATELLFFRDYHEIMSSMIHLTYSIYERISEKFPMLRDSLTEDIKAFHAALRYAEVSDDIQCLVKTLFQDICSGIKKVKQNPDLQNAFLVERIIEIIQADFANPALCLNSIANEIGLSANYAGHLFRNQTQKSISQYILEFRMEKVAEYLKNTSLPLSKILDKVGLEKNNYFYTRFKNYFGVSLNEYRKQFSTANAK